MDLQLQNRTCLVTGASRGIGRGTAKGMAAEGCRVAIVARRETLLEELADEIARAGYQRPLVIAEDLASEGGIAAIIGPIRSTQIQAASPTIAKSGIPTMIGGTDTSLTHVNNRWVFRARPNDSYSSRVIAEFGVNTLKLRKWAIVHSTDAFGSGGKAALTSALKSLGVEPVLVHGYTNNSQDFTPIVLAVKKSGAEILGTYMTNSPDVGIFSKQ